MDIKVWTSLKKWFYGVLLAVGLLMPSSEAWATSDWQYWHGYQLNAKLSDAFKARVNGQHRLRDDITDSFFGRIETAILWTPTSYFEIGPAYKYQRSQNLSGVYTNESRYYLESTLKYKWKSLGLSNRHRLAYRNKNSKDAWLYRTQFKASYPVQVGKVSFSPYVADEIFYDTQADLLNQNRVILGVKTKLTSSLSLSLYYMLRSDRAREGSWEETHILGSGLTLSI